MNAMRSAFGSVMGGKEGHKLYEDHAKRLQSQFTTKDVSKKRSKRAFMSKLIAFTGKSKEK